MKKRIFTGAGVAILTPMHEDGSINYDEFKKLIDWQIENGTDAVIVCGTTGECATMTEEEHLDCIRFAKEYVNGRVPVIAGAGSNDTAFAVQMVKECEKIGVDGLLVVTPYYNKTSQRGLIAHYKAVAAATSLPIIMYSVASRTGVNILPATCKELSKVENIVAIKEASGNIDQVTEIKALCGDDLDVYSGEDGIITPILSVGGIGVISVLSHLCPRETHEICQKYFDGDVKGSAALQLKYHDLVKALFSDVNPIPVKAAMNLMGWNVGHCRMPLIDMAPEAEEKLAQVMRSHGLI
ncbi:MAG: 4-hydroxy-tetrahydrodipicolinate synthase [Candidatus Faecivivens sp.]|nr:4-hydroxy-tetrahydrodipicolinate synthase [Oscillospiraceae bacterium]MDY2712235.1 4-hydroxy-tetrahydrodipicolinate synthase [Candidatus Faecivivens sp.]